MRNGCLKIGDHQKGYNIACGEAGDEQEEKDDAE
jgi:hypothetical protein